MMVDHEHPDDGLAVLRLLPESRRRRLRAETGSSGKTRRHESACNRRHPALLAQRVPHQHAPPIRVEKCAETTPVCRTQPVSLCREWRGLDVARLVYAKLL